MPRVTSPRGKELGEIAEGQLLEYYRGEGYQIDDSPRSSKPTSGAKRTRKRTTRSSTPKPAPDSAPDPSSKEQS